MGCRRCSAASRHEMLLDEDDFRSFFDELLNSEMFCFFHNCVRQSRYSEINFVLLFLIHQYGSPRTCLMFFNMFMCQHATHCGSVSTYWSPRTRWVCDFIMFLLIQSVAIKRGAFLDFLFLSTYGSPRT